MNQLVFGNIQQNYVQNTITTSDCTILHMYMTCTMSCMYQILHLHVHVKIFQHFYCTTILIPLYFSKPCGLCMLVMLCMFCVFFLCSSLFFLFLYALVVHYARDCPCMYNVPNTTSKCMSVNTRVCHTSALAKASHCGYSHTMYQQDCQLY